MQRVLTLIVLAGCSTFAFAQPVAEKGKATLMLDSGSHNGSVTQALFTPDSKRLVTISADKTIRIWDIASRESVALFRMPTGPGQDGELHAAALSADGKYLAVGGTGFVDGVKRRAPIYIVDLEAGRIVKVLEGHTDTVRSLSISADGKRLISGANDQTARLWDVVNAKSIRVITRESKKKKSTPGAFVRVAMAPDGRHAVTNGDGYEVQVYDAATGEARKVIHRSDPKLGGYSHVEWSPDSSIIAATSGGVKNTDRGVYLLTIDGAIVQKFGDAAPAASFGAHGKRLIVSPKTTIMGKRNAYDIYDVATGKLLQTILHSPGKGTLSPDGKLVAVVSGQVDAFSLWNADTATLVTILPDFERVTGYRPGYARWSKEDKDVSWLDLVKAKNLLSFHFGNSSLVKKDAANYHGTLRSMDGWTIRSNVVSKEGMRTIVLALPGNDKPTQQSTLIPNKKIAVASFSHRIHVFDIDGKLLRTLEGHNGEYNFNALAPSSDGKYVLSIATDRIAKIWALEHDRSEPLLNLHLVRKAKGNVATNEWIAWTPEGYYAASANGEKLIGWSVPGERDQMVTIATADRFRKQFHRPDVISRLLEFGSLDKALEAADKERDIKSTRTTIEDATPPTVTLTVPAAIKEAGVPVHVKAASQGKFPITELQLLVNGRPHAKGLHTVATPKLGPVEASWKIELDPGSHIISVVARTAVSTGVSSDVEVIYVPSVPPDPKTLRPSLHVLSVGINSYPGDWRLHCATNDAEKIKKVFEERSTATYSGVSSKLLTDVQATKENILAELAALRKNVKPQDVAVIFFAGHGIKGKKGAFYLCPHGTNFADENKIRETAISNDEIKRTLSKMQGRILVMLDACHSGASRLEDFARELTDDDCGVIVMCAAMGRESAGEEKKLGHGYFAKAIIDGLGGKADISRKDGQIYLHHLESYVIEAVQDWSKDEQHPVMSKPLSVRSFALAKPAR